MDIDALFKMVGLLVRNRYAIDVPEVVNPEKNPNMSDGDGICILDKTAENIQRASLCDVPHWRSGLIDLDVLEPTFLAFNVLS